MPSSNEDELSPEDAREIERRMNIHRLKGEIKAITGVEMTTSESQGAPSTVLEGFYENIAAFERAPLVTTHQKLAKAGILMPPEAELNDADLSARLWQIIEWMAARQHFLSDTDHLSDRQLYTYLRDEGFSEPMPDIPAASGMRCHLSPIGSGSAEDTLIHFRYFADEDSRQSWMQQFPDYKMPDPLEPPHDRDQFLPQANYPLLKIDWEDGDEEFEEWGEDDASPDKPA